MECKGTCWRHGNRYLCGRVHCSRRSVYLVSHAKEWITLLQVLFVGPSAVRWSLVIKIGLGHNPLLRIDLHSSQLLLAHLLYLISCIFLVVFVVMNLEYLNTCWRHRNRCLWGRVPCLRRRVVVSVGQWFHWFGGMGRPCVPPLKTKINLLLPFLGSDSTNGLPSFCLISMLNNLYINCGPFVVLITLLVIIELRYSRMGF